MRVLIGCECSGVVRRAFRNAGHDAWSCDIVESDDNSPYHLQCDVTEVMNDNYDLAIFHPPCTYLCNSGVRWLDTVPGRRASMVLAAEFFRKCLAANAVSVAVENPIPHKYALRIIGERYSQIVQPWQFGHGETKATCLWLRNLPLLQPTNIVPGRDGRCHRLPPGPNRSKLRAITYSGIATAMATQWSEQAVALDRCK